MGSFGINAKEPCSYELSAVCCHCRWHNLYLWTVLLIMGPHILHMYVLFLFFPYLPLLSICLIIEPSNCTLGPSTRKEPGHFDLEYQICRNFSVCHIYDFLTHTYLMHHMNQRFMLH